MKSTHPDFTPPSPKIEARVETLLATLTLDEKLRLLAGSHQKTLGVEEKGIPELKLADGPVGCHWWCEKSTAYPALIALAASFNPDMARRFGSAIGRDCRARGVHALLAPGVNIYRSPLCGRNFEYMGEDPWLSSRIAVGYVEGVQGEGVSATVKHYACNFQEFDRHGVSSNADERTLREIYLPAFEATVKEAGTGAIMTGYNLVNGQHCAEHDWLNNVVLRDEWGFDGLIMSDWVSVYSTVGAANGGLDLEMPYKVWFTEEKLKDALTQGTVTEATLDDKVKNQLRLAACFGWLDREQKIESIPEDDPTSAAVALEVARQGCVLLKNEGDILPLSPDRVKKIVAVGTHIRQPVIAGGGSAYTEPYHAQSIEDGLKAIAPEGVEIEFFTGATPFNFDASYQNAEFTTPDGEQGLKAEYFNNRKLEGPPAVVRTDERIACEWWHQKPGEGIDSDNFSVRWTGSITVDESTEYIFHVSSNDGDYAVFFDGEELFNSNGKCLSGALAVHRELEAGKAYSVDVQFRQTRGWNGMFFGYQKTRDLMGDLDKAVEAARNADAVIVGLGFDSKTEGEGFDRAFEVNPLLLEMLNQLADANENTVVTLHAGGGVEMESWLSNAKALLNVWYPGQEGGQAVAEILFGNVNPSGKLPASIERKLEDRRSFTSYHDHDGDNIVWLEDGIFTGYRGLLADAIEPLFPFGFGLSYTTFAVSDLKVSGNTWSAENGLTVSATVTNTGSRAGAEVVQLYLGLPEVDAPRPPRELKAFERVALEAGERKRVEFSLTAQSLRQFATSRKSWLIAEGTYSLHLGQSATDCPLHSEFSVEEDILLDA